MRVLHVITALGVGGAERMLLKLLGAPALRAVQQDVVALLPTGPLAAQMRQTGARVTALNLLGGIPVIRGSWQLARLARRMQPHVVQGWMYHGNLGAALARLAVGGSTPLIWGIRQSLSTLDGENAFARAGIALNRLGSRWPDRLLFNSRTSMQQHAERGFCMARAQYIANGFDTVAFAPDAAARARSRQAWGVDNDAVVFGVLARYHPAKGHQVFIDAARELCAQREQAQFVMAGTGIEAGHAELLQMLEAAGVRQRFRLLGERNDMAAVMAGLDVCVSPSTRIEAFSNTVGEAMSCALPCVVTAVGDSPQLVADSGMTVAPGDAAALARAMRDLLDAGPAGRAALGALARQRVQATYALDVVAQQYAALYQELAGRNP